MTLKAIRQFCLNPFYMLTHHAHFRLRLGQSSFIFTLGFFALCLFGLAFSGFLRAAEEVDFANDIQTVLARRCYSCHGPDLQEGSIRFDDRSTLVSEADTGEIPIVPGDASKSEMIRRIESSEDYERMPPEGKPLSSEEIASIRAWIEAGAEYEQHWAFQPVRSPELPEVQTASWPLVSLDTFILARLEEAELKPVAEASPETLVRRIFMDTTGLPATPEQISASVENWREGSYERLVDQLLADPAFGERWARNWLDVVRYSETNSFERDNAKPNAWKYRDYVIRAMNSDKPYDQFIREQIAGDELPQVTEDSLTATGYYRLGLWDDEPADPKLALYDGFDDLVTTTGQGILALTMNCARCHDHKIDPISQKDYYSFVAFLRDVTPYGTRGDQSSNNQLDLDRDLAARHREYSQRSQELEKQLRKIERTAIKKMDAEDQRATEGPEREETLKAKLKDFVTAQVFQNYQHLKSELDDIREQQSLLPPRETVLGLATLDPQPPETHLLVRGSPEAEGEVVKPAFPKLLGGGEPDIPTASNEARSAGRRIVLADWLASKDNWMTARVIVNRIWLHYFGRGIVRSPNNFGLMGEAPTHPELIDHLATKLMQNDWQLKTIHREILLSRTYRLSTTDSPQARAQDPANNLFWRQNLRRLSAEQVRDSILAVTGQLNEQKFGQSMYPKLSEEVLASQSRPGQGWGNSSQADQARRSIYIHVKRSLPVPLLTAFDFPETDVSCEARFLTTQPAQALTLLNSDWMQQQASHFLSRIEQEVGDDLSKQAARALALCTGRQAHPEDVEELVSLVHRLQEKQHLNEHEARKAMCLVALNLNQFLYLD